MSDLVWLRHRETGGYAHLPPAAVEAWQAWGWDPVDAGPPEPDPTQPAEPEPPTETPAPPDDPAASSSPKPGSRRTASKGGNE